VVDETKNHADSSEERDIGVDHAPVAVLVIPTNEELEIATQTLACLERGRGDA
jgi:acetate kinase